jgi:20S proteasome subunit alpha 5
MTPYVAHAIGNGAEGAITILQEKYSRSMTLADAEMLVLRILKETLEEKVSTSNVQLATVGRGIVGTLTHP